MSKYTKQLPTTHYKTMINLIDYLQNLNKETWLQVFKPSFFKNSGEDYNIYREDLKILSDCMVFLARKKNMPLYITEKIKDLLSNHIFSNNYKINLLQKNDDGGYNYPKKHKYFMIVDFEFYNRDDMVVRIML